MDPNIELIALDWQEFLNRLSALATSDLARQELKNTRALASVENARDSVVAIDEWAAPLTKNLRPHMESLDLFSQWHQRLARNAVLKTLELKDVRMFCQEVLALRETLIEVPSTPHLVSVRDSLMDAEEPLSAIDQVMTADGDIRNDASERLFQLNSEKAQLARQVQTILDRLVKSYNLEHLLQERFVTTREGRWVLPVKSGMQHGFEGIIHDASQSRQTVFMEPKEAVPLNNRLREIELAIEEEIERLLQDLSHYLATQRFAFEESKKLLLIADCRLAQARMAMQIQATACDFSADEIDLQQLRHPILALNKVPVVPNNVELRQDRRILLLSGPNAGGKTILLKSIGLAAQMARCGLPICARNGSRLPFFKTLVVALGDSQSVDANLSTFAAHLKALERATLAKGANSLLLIDEICGSTDPEEGAALARSFLETYKKNGSFGIVTSHLGALKRGWEADSGVVNGSLEFNKNSGPTYRFILGVPGQSLAIQTAERVGIDDAIVARAREYLSPEMRHYQGALSEIEQMKKEIFSLQDKLAVELKAAETERSKLETEREKFARERDTLLDKELKKAQKQVDDLLQETKAQEIFRRHERLAEIKHELPQVVKADGARRVSAGARGNGGGGGILSAEDFAKAYPPGSNVHIESLGRDGIVQSAPNNREEVSVLSSSMRLTMHWRDLRPSLRTESPTQKILRNNLNYALSPAESDRVMDVRGLTVEEALSQLEMQLDAASVAGEDRVKVVHGHGTDSLKRGMRSYLSRSVYVKKWQAGTAETGGDGVTWVELK